MKEAAPHFDGMEVAAAGRGHEREIRQLQVRLKAEVGGRTIAVVPMVLVWSCAICGSRMRTLFPKKQPAHAGSAKRVEIAVHCAACGGPHKLEILETQPLDGVTTSAEREE